MAGKKATLTTPIPSVEATAAQYGVSQQDLERVRKAVGMTLVHGWPGGRIGAIPLKSSQFASRRLTGLMKHGGANLRLAVIAPARGRRITVPKTGRTRAKK